MDQDRNKVLPPIRVSEAELARWKKASDRHLTTSSFSDFIRVAIEAMAAKILGGPKGPDDWGID